MAYNDNNFGGDSGNRNVWSSGSRGGSGGGYSRPSDDNDDDGQRGGGSYRGSFGNNNSSRGGGGGGYGFRRQNDGDVQILTDAIFIQNLPKNITREEIVDAFSTVGPIKVDDRSGGPKVWIYKDRDTGEGNGRATITYEDDETANKAIAEFNDRHIDSIDSVVRVQLAQRRNRNDNDRGSRGGYRGGRSNWDNNNPRQGFNFDSNRWSNPRGGGFSDNRSEGFRSRGGGSGGDSFRDSDDRGGSYRGNQGVAYRGGNRNGSYRGASHGNSGSSNYSPY